jgi:hypothetical protein
MPEPEDATYMESVTFTATISGVRDAFDSSAYIDGLARLFFTQGIPASAISIEFTRRRALSARQLQTTFAVTATIVSGAQTAAVASVLRAETPTTLTNTLGAEVATVTAPVVGRVLAYPPPPSPSLPEGYTQLDDGRIVPDSAGQGQSASGSSDDSAIGIGIGVGVFGLIVLVVGVVLIRRNMLKRTSTVVKAVPVQTVGATSTTTDPPPAGLELDESKI